MKLLRSFFIATLAFSWGHAEMRTYHSKDGTKTFRGDLIEFNEETRMAKMRMARNRVLEFPIKVLSEEDQEFVIKQGPILQAHKSLRLETKHRSERTEQNKPAPGQWHFEKYDHHYVITVENSRKEHLEEVEVDYTFFIERNRREFQNKIEKVSGSTTINLLLANTEETVTTKTANLEAWSDNPIIRGGGAGGG